MRICRRLPSATLNTYTGVMSKIVTVVGFITRPEECGTVKSATFPPRVALPRGDKIWQVRKWFTPAGPKKAVQEVVAAPFWLVTPPIRIMRMASSTVRSVSCSSVFGKYRV